MTKIIEHNEKIYTIIPFHQHWAICVEKELMTNDLVIVELENCRKIKENEEPTHIVGNKFEQTNFVSGEMIPTYPLIRRKVLEGKI